MSQTLNAQTKANLSRRVKDLHEKCVDICNIIENSQLDDGVSHENVGEKALCYVEGLRNSIRNSNTHIDNDDNFVLNEFLAESKKTLVQIEELTAFTRGAISDVENEIQRLDKLTNTAHEALSRPRVVQNEIRTEHIHKAKANFQMLKSELHRVIQALYPNKSDLIMDIIGQLLQEKTNEESSGYIPITNEAYPIFELLKDMNLVSINPYNNLEAKLAY